MIRSARRLTLAATAAIASLAIGASAAQASITLSTSTPTTGTSVTVTVHMPIFSPNAATFYALAECNTTTGGPTVWATKCNGASGRFSGPNPIPSSTFSDSIIVDRQFTNVDFSGGTGSGHHDVPGLLRQHAAVLGDGLLLLPAGRGPAVPWRREGRHHFLMR